MLFRGVNKKKLVRLLIVLLVALLIFIGVCVLSIFLFFLWLEAGSTRPDPSEDKYFKKMLILQKTSDTVRVGDVFDFDFDEAYVSSRPYGDATSYLDRLDVETNVPILSWDSGGHYRILFIKDQCIIYDFVYDTRTIDTLQKDVMISPDTTMTFTTEVYPSGRNYLRITFDDSIVTDILY